MLDLKVIVATDQTHNELETMLKIYSDIENLQSQINSYENTIQLIEEAMVIEISKGKENENTVINTFQPRIEHFTDKIKTKVCNNYIYIIYIHATLKFMYM